MAARPAVAALALVAGLTPARADFAADEYPAYERCALCHGLFGVSHTSKFPNLAGQKPLYLETQIKAFHDGLRTNDGGQMASIVTELKPEDIPIVIEWFSSQAAPKALDLGDTSQGAGHYAELGCAECHDDPDAPAPYLSAQHPEYLTKQMEDFRDERRAGSPIASMHRNLLMDAEIKAISLYLAAQERE